MGVVLGDDAIGLHRTLAVARIHHHHDRLREPRLVEVVSERPCHVFAPVRFEEGVFFVGIEADQTLHVLVVELRRHAAVRREGEAERFWRAGAERRTVLAAQHVALDAGRGAYRSVGANCREVVVGEAEEEDGVAFRFRRGRVSVPEREVVERHVGCRRAALRRAEGRENAVSARRQRNVHGDIVPLACLDGLIGDCPVNRERHLPAVLADAFEPRLDGAGGGSAPVAEGQPGETPRRRRLVRRHVDRKARADRLGRRVHDRSGEVNGCNRVRLLQQQRAPAARGHRRVGRAEP